MDQPYLHPRWDDQVLLEKEMLDIGVARTTEKINKAIEKRDMNRLRPHRNLLQEWVLPVTSGVEDWLDSYRGKPGPKPVAFKRIDEIGAETCAFIALKALLKDLGNDKAKTFVLGAAITIGTQCEHEARAKAWMNFEEFDEETGVKLLSSWNILDRYYKNRGSTIAHKRRARVVIFNKYMRDKLKWEDWSEAERQHTGMALIGIVCKKTQRFSVIPDPDWVPRKKSKPGSKRKRKARARPLVVYPDPKLVEWLGDALDAELVAKQAFLPTIIPPKPWTSPRSGGYWTPYVKAPFMIRFKAQNENTRQKALDEYEALDMPEVYEAVNIVQNVKWKINKDVLKVFEAFWEKRITLGDLPPREALTVPKRPADAEIDSDTHKDWARKVSDIRMRNARMVGKMIGHMRLLWAARRFTDEPEFYLPHMLDFRGRLYAIPSDLNPQGHDLARALLTFAEGKPVGENGGWLAIQLANVWGYDKESYDDRIDWVNDREAMWRSIAANPEGDRRWLEGSDPWQTLAAVCEWVRYLDEGPDYVSSLPIRVDGTCNGIQHLSAMARDAVGAASVNLLPSDKPRDIYQEVADTLTEKLKDSTSMYSMAWLDETNGGLPRSLTKRPVMILPYGGTRNAYVRYIMDWVRSEGNGTFEGDEWNASVWLAQPMWDAVNDKVPEAMRVMEWIKENAKVAAKTGKPLFWRTPAGFIVRHFYGQVETKRFKTLMDGQSLHLRVRHYNTDLDTRAVGQGIAPNFVHSMDAASLMIAMRYSFYSGVKDLTVIHDSFGTVAADMWTLQKCITEAFVDTYSEDVLQQFQDACREVAEPDAKLPEPFRKGSLDLEEVHKSLYFFS